MSYLSEVLADSPLLYVRFEETAGATCANDGSLGGNATAAGTYTRNISTGMAGVGVGIDLDGTSGIVTYPDNASLDITGDVTYECWINADALGGVGLMSKGQSAGAAGSYYMRLLAGGQIRITNQNGGVNVLTSGVVITTGTWIHVAFTRSGNNYTLYINGSSSTTSTDATAGTANSELFGIGHNQFNGAAGSFFNGKIDEAAVYNTALSGARISAHYAARNTAAPTVTFVPQTIVIT